MDKIEELVKQCMDSGWFKSEETARNYVMNWCLPKEEKPLCIDEDEEVFPIKKPLRLEDLP